MLEDASIFPHHFLDITSVYILLCRREKANILGYHGIVISLLACLSIR